jgi:hypothetical protein
MGGSLFAGKVEGTQVVEGCEQLGEAGAMQVGK